MKERKPKKILEASELGIEPLAGEDDLFRWFLFSFLTGKPIQSTVAVRTWRLFIERKVDFPWAIIELPDMKLVQLLHSGGYTRYQHVMTKAIKKCMQQLIDFYDGSLTLMIESSENDEALAKRLTKLYGVGPRTAEIFMRETIELFARRVE